MLLPRHGRLDRYDVGQSQQRRLLLQAPAQQALGGQAVERVRRTVGPAVLGHGRDDPGQRLDGRHVTVEDGERLAVVSADADLQAHGARVRIVDDPADL